MNDTSIQKPKVLNGTSAEFGNSYLGKIRCNRKICRYAKKYNITEEEAIRRLYK